jgi:NADH:ubiquinone oxidoreductase subunit B-like Fe-S oxidoreductase
MAQILGNQQPQQPSLDWSQAQDFTCSHCGGEYFINAVMVKKFSKFVTGTTNDAVVPVDILLCGSCGKPVDELIPHQLRKKPEQPQTTNSEETQSTKAEETTIEKSSLSFDI